MQRVNYAGFVGVEYVWQEWEHNDEVDNVSEIGHAARQAAGGRAGLSGRGSTMPDSVRVAIVTGAGRGVGAAVSRALSRTGARVAVCDIEPALAEEVAAAIEAGGGAAVALANDIGRPRLDRLVQEALEQLGRVDILVNNAAICPRISIDDMTEARFDRIIDVNLKSVFFLSRAAGNAMRKHGWGRIVNVSSDRWPDRRHLQRDGVQRVQGRRHVDDQGLCAALRARRHPGQLCRARHGQHAPDDQSVAGGRCETTIEAVPLKRLADPSEIAQV